MNRSVNECNACSITFIYFQAYGHTYEGIYIFFGESLVSAYIRFELDDVTCAKPTHLIANLLKNTLAWSFILFGTCHVNTSMSAIINRDVKNYLINTSYWHSVPQLPTLSKYTAAWENVNTSTTISNLNKGRFQLCRF